MNLIDQIKADREAGTPGPWKPCNMVHADRGDQMTPEEIGEYVANSVRMGDLSRFLFVSGKHSDGGDCDVCHTGNGPRGPANTRRIARVPDMEAALLAAEGLYKALELCLDDILLGWLSMPDVEDNFNTDNSHCATQEAAAALAAFRKAIGDEK